MLSCKSLHGKKNRQKSSYRISTCQNVTCIVNSDGIKLLLCCLSLSGKLQTAEKSTPKPFSIGLRAFFSKSNAQKKLTMMVGFAARGQDKSRMGLPKAPYPKKASAPFLWKKNRPLFLLLSVPTPRGVLPWCKCLPMGRDSVFGGYSDRVGIRQNLDGSVSQRAFAPEGRGSTSTLRYMDAAGRRDEGKVVFYQAQK